MSWPQVKISEVTEIVSGATPKTGMSNYWGGNIAWATPADLSDLAGSYIDDTTRKITEAGLRSCPASVLPANSVLFSSRAPIGHVAINAVPMATNQGFKSFVPDTTVLDAKFLFWWLKAHRKQIEAMGSGATFKEVSKATVSRVEIPLPPIHEQKRIAAILDKADHLRQKRRQAIALLDSLTQSIFLEMFGDIRDNPKGMPKASLGEICTFKGGAQPPKSTFSYDDGLDKIRFIQIRDYKSDRFKTFIPRTLAKRFCDETDIMIGRYGPPVFQILRGIAGSYNVALMKAEPNKGIGKAFLFYLLSTSKLQSDVISQSQRTAGQTGVNLDYLENYQVFKPSLEDQRQFQRRVEIAERELLAANSHLHGVETLFSSLQHRAFSGQL